MRAPLLAAAVGLLACGPVGPFAGGRLSGELVAEPVGDWSFARDVETVQLETRPDDPYSVNIWCATDGARLYVPSSMIFGPDEPSERDWVRNVLADARVRIRIGSELYERRATRVTDAEELERARELLSAKYELETGENGREQRAWIFRLDAR